jgi:isopropylmalate/homocitrate/citramalate synthase
VGLREEMERCQWGEGHLLIHVHKQFGLADYIVLEALAHGCTGIWCAVCEEGAGVGHACSLVAPTNLSRLGNEFVTANFNMPAMYAAAIAVTRCSSDAPPFQKQEVYGAGALDVVSRPALTFLTHTPHSN